VRARFTIVGGGGAAGDNYDGTGGAGGPGNIVNGTLPISAGQRIWVRLGCGGTDALSWEDWNGRRAAGWARGGGAEDYYGGGGGGATGLCVGTSAGGCSGGTMYAIAGGGGGGGRGSGTGTCNPANGGGGGYNTFDPNISANGGIGRNAGGGISGANNGSVGGGGGGNGVGGGAGSGASGGGSSANPPQVEPGENGSGGRGANGSNDITGGGGGGGYSGGGGGGGGADPTCAWPISGTPRGGAGGGAGSSWVRSNVFNSSWGHANAWTNGCGDGLGGSVGHAAPAGTGARGCHGYAWVTWEVNTPPGGNGFTAGTATKGTPLSISLPNSDSDDARTCQIVSGPSKGTYSLSGGAPSTSCSMSYTAGANQSGNDTFTYRVQDVLGATSATYTVTVPIQNRNPVSAAQTVTATKGVGLGITLGASDPDGDTVSCSIATGPTKGGLSGSGCSRTYTANAGTFGQDSFTYTVADSIGATSTSTVTLNIQNGAPTSAGQTVTVAPGATTTIALGGADPDGDPTTCATSAPDGGTLQGGTGCSRTYTAPSALGTHTFTYTRSDGVLTSAPATVVVDVQASDVALSKTHVGVFNDGTQGTYDLAVTNVGNGPTAGTVTVVDTLPAGMTYVSSNPGTSGFTCTPSSGDTVVTCTRTTALAAGATAPFTITVAVAPGAASGTNTATVSATPDHSSANDTADDATTVNLRPSATPVTAATTVGTPVAVTLAGTDPEGQALTYQAGTPSSGSLSGTAPDLTFTPAPGSDAEVTFTYTVTDPHGHTSVSVPVTITVTRPGVHGLVTADGSGDGIEGITVRLYRDGVGFTSYGTTTDATGWYDLGGSVPDGTYRVIFRDPDQDFVDEWYDDSLLRSTSTTVTVGGGAEITADAGLAEGAEIDVTITNPGTYTVGLYNSGPVGASAYRSVPNVTGSTSLRGLPAGTYYVSVTDPTGALLAKWSGNETVRGEAEAIALGAGAAAVRSFTLPAPNTIEGTIVDAEGPVPMVTVQAYNATTATYVKAAKTDAEGEYVIKGLPAGLYKIIFRSAGAHPVVWLGGGEVITSGSTVAMTNGGVLTVDGTLALPATVSGTVTGGAGGTTPLAGAKVTLYRNGTAVRTYVTDATGGYEASGLAAGAYTALFTAPGHRSEYNLDRPRKADADPVVVEAGTVVTIDATLAPT
jgi:uncharacterized repeat protein (TIGR01451 family)